MSFFAVENIISPMNTWKFAGFKNYMSLLHAPVFLKSMANIFKLWFFSGIVTIFLSFLFSIAFTTDLRFKQFFRTIVYMPNVIAAVAVGYMWLLYVYNSKFGMLTTFFKSVGWQSMAQFQWLDGDHIFLSMSIAYIYGNVGYYMMIYIAGIEKIPMDFYEAARIEGANVFVQFFKITLPLIKGVFSTSAVLWTTRTMGFFALSQVFSSVRTYTPMLFTYETLFGTELSQQGMNAGIAASSAVFMTVVVVIVSTLMGKLMKEDGNTIE
jgi:multiple sugar transport system permease protein